MRELCRLLVIATLGLGLFSVLINCAPIRVKEHQVRDGAGDRCGRGSSTSYAIKHPDIEIAAVQLDADPSHTQLILRATFWGKIGKKMKFSPEAIKILYADGSSYLAQTKLFRKQLKEDPRISPLEEVVNLGVDQSFKLDHGYRQSFLELRGQFPYKAQDLVVNLPKISIENDELPAQTIKYRFVDKWIFSPLNGC